MTQNENIELEEIELSDGGVIEVPDSDDGTIRRRDVHPKDARDAIAVVLNLLDGLEAKDIIVTTGLPQKRAEEIMVIYQKLLSRYGSM